MTAAPFDLFQQRLSSLCVAAGPPAPSFSHADLDAALASVATNAKGERHTAETLAPVFAAIDSRLSADLHTTPLSVRSMLWELLVRACERSAAQAVMQGGRDEWSAIVAPQLYRLVMLVVPKAEDATANVPLAKQTLRRWLAAAEASSSASSSSAAVTAPTLFKKPQLINALKYVEGYVYEPPRRSEAELQASRDAKRERKRQRRREEEERAERRRRALANGHRKRSRSSGSRSGSLTPGSAAASSNVAAAAGGTAAPALPTAAVSPSRSASDGSSPSGASPSRSPSQSPSTRRRYRNRSAVSHTASEEAYASRFLEQLRASQKRAHVEGSLRAEDESIQGWEEWAETVDYIRDERKRQRRSAAASSLTSSADTAAASSSVSDTPMIVPSAVDSSSSSSPSLQSFLSSWLSARNHWKPLRDEWGEGEGTPSEGGRHQVDQWMRYYHAHGMPLPTASIAGGATRLWSVLNDNAASAKYPSPMLPTPIPQSALAIYAQHTITTEDAASK